MLGRRAIFKGALAMPFGQAKTQGFAEPVLSTFAAGNTIINKTGEFRYSPSPGFGKLVYSNTSATGVDKYGNHYLSQEVMYAAGGPGLLAWQIAPGVMFQWQATSFAGPWTQTGTEIGFGAVQRLILQANGNSSLSLSGPGVNPGVATTGIGGNSIGFFMTTNTFGTSAAEIWYGASGDNTGATDRAFINAFLNLGYVVRLMPSTYFIDQPIVIPDQGTLTGSDDVAWGIPTGNYGAGSLPLQGAVIQAGSAFAGAVLISMGSAGTVQHGGQRIENITLSGTNAPANTHGIQSIGYVAGVKLKDVVVWGGANIQDGLHMANDDTAGHQADFWQVHNCKFSNCAGWGVSMVGVSDSWFTDTESTGNTLGGWTISGGADTRFIGCRADSNGGVPGWNLTPTSASNFLSWTNCEANLNGTGWVFNAGSAATYCLSNCISHDNTSAIYSYTAGAAVRTDGGNFSVWVPLTPNNGWANSGVGPNAKYCWRGSSVEIIADLTAPTPISGAGTAIFSLPGAAALAHVQQLDMIDITTRTARAALNVGVAGAVTFFQGIGTVIAGDRVFVHGFVSTDA